MKSLSKIFFTAAFLLMLFAFSSCGLFRKCNTCPSFSKVKNERKENIICAGPYAGQVSVN
jgi:hypothetical protein